MILKINNSWDFKGGYLDFSHLNELKNMYITEIYMIKQFKSSITKNHKIKRNIVFGGVPLKCYVASYAIFRFCAGKKKHCVKTN